MFERLKQRSLLGSLACSLARSEELGNLDESPT